ncbi:hypothetical protein ACIPW5_04945 [Streptomyces sp. NPDC090077]|uniref:hypothetical protein n=1 Tax=Streptomyces sp. NPDC090077 TaxID=3365938 RepID=UPI003817F983
MRVTDFGPDPASDPRADPDLGPEHRSDPHAGPVVRADSGRLGSDPHGGPDVRARAGLGPGVRADPGPDASAHGGPRLRTGPDVGTAFVPSPHVHAGPGLHPRADGEPVRLRADPRAGSDAGPHPRTADVRPSVSGVARAAQAPDRVPGGADHSNVWVQKRAGRRLLTGTPGPHSRSRGSPVRGRYGRGTGAFLEHQCQPAAQMEDTVHPGPAPAPCRPGFEQRRRTSPAARPARPQPSGIRAHRAVRADTRWAA